MAQIDMMLYILIDLNDLNDMTIVSLILDHSKIRKMPFWMIQIAKNKDLGHFHGFGVSDWVDIAYFDRTEWFAHRVIHAESFKNPKDAFLNDPNTPKKLSLVCLICVILHVLADEILT